MLTLSEAIKTKRLQDFIAQEEARGVPAAELKEFQDLASRLKHRKSVRRGFGP